MEKERKNDRKHTKLCSLKEIGNEIIAAYAVN